MYGSAVPAGHGSTDTSANVLCSESSTAIACGATLRAAFFPILPKNKAQDALLELYLAYGPHIQPEIHDMDGSFGMDRRFGC